MTRALVALALAFAALLVATEWIPPYELMHDELYCTIFRPDAPIVLATGPVRPLEALLREWGHFGIDPVPELSAGVSALSD